MWINMLVRTYAWIGLLSERRFIQQVLSFFGLGNQELLYTEGAVLLGMVYNFLPFMIYRFIHPSAKWITPCWKPAQTWAPIRPRPLCGSLPPVPSGRYQRDHTGISACGSSFFIPKLLGGGQYFLIGNLIENQFITAGEWNFGSAISMIMAVIMILMMAAVRKSRKRNHGGEA